ncbi:hypothetical protein IFR05_015207 [Cadophora sp. M221]|nr:hypothetical protein IFR05_015207 [Cadophora sp. M221]
MSEPMPTGTPLQSELASLNPTTLLRRKFAENRKLREEAQNPNTRKPSSPLLFQVQSLTSSQSKNSQDQAKDDTNNEIASLMTALQEMVKIREEDAKKREEDAKKREEDSNVMRGVLVALVKLTQQVLAKRPLE